jgi:cytidine deaminase
MSAAQEQSDGRSELRVLDFPFRDSTIMRDYLLIPSGEEVVAPLPHDLSHEKFEDLTSRERVAVRVAEEAARLAYSPYHGFQVGAAFIVNQGRDIIPGANVDLALRGKNCAEKNALAAVIARGYKSIEEIVITTCQKGRLELGFAPVSLPSEFTPAIGPCGNCRTVLAPFVEADTRVIMTSSDRKTVMTTTMGALLPLHFSPVDLDTALHSAMINSLRIQNLSDLDPFYRNLLSEAEQVKSKSVVPLTGRAVGAAAASLGEVTVIYPGAKLEADPHVGGHSAETAALTAAATLGDTIIKAIAIDYDPLQEKRAFASPDGESRQMLLEFAQLGGLDIDVIMRTSDSQRVAVCKASDLIPLGAGPLEYGPQRGLFHLYRRWAGYTQTGFLRQFAQHAEDSD